MKNVLMIGLGGGSIQRLPALLSDVTLDTVELDPTVVQIAKNTFSSTSHRRSGVHVSDGGFICAEPRRSSDAIIWTLTNGAYGSFIPVSPGHEGILRLARDHLTEDGVVAYNVIGTLQGWRGDILGAVYKTMKSVFPQVYLFPATDSWNIVMVASKKPEPLTLPILQPRVAELIARGRATPATFRAG